MNSTPNTNNTLQQSAFEARHETKVRSSTSATQSQKRPSLAEIQNQMNETNRITPIVRSFIHQPHYNPQEIIPRVLDFVATQQDMANFRDAFLPLAPLNNAGLLTYKVVKRGKIAELQARINQAIRASSIPIVRSFIGHSDLYASNVMRLILEFSTAEGIAHIRKALDPLALLDQGTYAVITKDFCEKFDALNAQARMSLVALLQQKDPLLVDMLLEKTKLGPKTTLLCAANKDNGQLLSHVLTKFTFSQEKLRDALAAAIAKEATSCIRLLRPRIKELDERTVNQIAPLLAAEELLMKLEKADASTKIPLQVFTNVLKPLSFPLSDKPSLQSQLMQSIDRFFVHYADQLEALIEKDGVDLDFLLSKAMRSTSNCSQIVLAILRSSSVQFVSDQVLLSLQKEHRGDLEIEEVLNPILKKRQLPETRETGIRFGFSPV